MVSETDSREVNQYEILVDLQTFKNHLFPRLFDFFELISFCTTKPTSLTPLEGATLALLPL